MALESILSQEIIQRLGWTLLHLVWQAAAIALLLAILLSALRKASANLRYTIACLALGLIVLLPAVTMQLVGVSVAQPPAAVSEPAPAPVALPAEPIREMPIAEMPVVEKRAKVERVATVTMVPWRQRAGEHLESALPYVVSGWLLGVFALSLWNLGGWTQLQRLRRRMVKPVDASRLAKLDELAERLGIKRAVQLTESALVQIPTVVGWLHPVILLPASALTGLGAEQLEAILAHELAHIRRHDYLINMLQTIVETLGFYHPAVWWVSHRIRAERENCCDDLAVGISGDRVGYARALASMEEIRAGRSELAMAASGGNLLRRIGRLLGKDSSQRTFSWIPAVIVISLLVALIISTTLALTTNEKYPTAELITNKSVNGQPENEPLHAEKNNSSITVLIETQIIHVNNEFLEQVGLDASSLKNPNSWTQYRVDDSSNPSMFVIDSHKKEMLLKTVAESEDSSSISHIFLMAMCGQEAMIKNSSGYDFKSHELARSIKIEPELSQDGQSTYLDFELMTRQFESLKLFSDVYINKKVDQDDVSESEIAEYQVNAENVLLSDDHTLLIFGGKLVSLRDVENGTPILRNIPVTGKFYNTTSKFEGQKNEIILIKTSIVPPERSDDIDSKASSYNVANYNVTIRGSKASELLRICLDLHLEAGQYVEIKDRGQRESKFVQVDAGDIGKSGKDWPAYADYIDFEIRSNFDLNLSTKRYTRGSFFEHDKWDSYFTGPDTIIGNGYFSPTTLCVSMWRVKLHELIAADDDIITSLVAVIIEPNNEQQKPSAQFLLDKMLEHRCRLKTLEYVAGYEIWWDLAAKEDMIEEIRKRMRDRGISERHIQRMAQRSTQSSERSYQILECKIDEAGRRKIWLTGGSYDSSGKRTPGRKSSYGPKDMPNLRHPWRACTAILCKFLAETITAGKQVDVGKLKDGTYRIAFDYKTGRIVAVIDPSKGYTCILEEFYDKQGHLTSRTTAKYEEIAEGIWFPVSSQCQRYASDSLIRKSTSKSSQIKINDPDFDFGYVEEDQPKDKQVEDHAHDPNESQKSSAGEEQIDPVKKWSIGEQESPAESVGSSPVIAKSPISPGEDKPIIRVDCRVLEIYPSMKLDRETTIAAENLLGETPTVRVGRDGVPTNPGRTSRRSASTFEEWIREVTGTTVLSEEPSIVTGNGQTTRKMIDLLVSRGYMKILMAPTVEVRDGFKGRVSSKQRVPMGKATAPSTQSDHYIDIVDYFEITPHVLVDGGIKLLTEGTINTQLPRQDKGQPPIFAKFSFSDNVVVGPDMCLMIGGTQKTDSGTEDSEKPQTKVLFIFTPTIVDPAAEQQREADTQVEDENAGARESVEESTAATDSSASALAKNPKAHAEDKAHIDVDCVVLEIPRPLTMNEKIANMLDNVPMPGWGLYMSSVDQLLGETAADKRTPRQRREVLIEKLTAGGGRMWVHPTLKIAEGQTRKFETDGNFVGVTPHIGKDGHIVMQLDAEITSKFIQDHRRQNPIVTRRTSSSTVAVRPGQSVIIGSVVRTEEDGEGGNNATKSEENAAELVFIVTPMMADTGKPPDKTDQEQERRKIEGETQREFREQTEADRQSRITELINGAVFHEKQQRFEAALGPSEAAVGSDTEDSRVKESAKMLMYFGRAMLIYANDHDDRYPNMPHQLREHLTSDQFAWAMRNVEYLAGGRTTSSRPEVVTAYDVKLMAQEKGTNVLFNDCHVEFVEPERLSELNLRDTPVVIETRILTADDDFLKSIEQDANLVGTSELWLEHLRAASAAELNSQPYMVILDDTEASLLLSAVAAHYSTKMLAAPKVCALDGREAIIKVVSEVYYLPRASEPNDSSGRAKPKPEPIEIGTSVRLTPHLTPDKDSVLLDFEWVLRQIRGFEQRTGPDKKKQRFPPVSVNEISTTARIPDSKTLLVGRKITEQVEVRSKTPVLGDLPLVGGLFRSHAKITDQKTLLILIKTTVDPQMSHSPKPPSLDPDDPLAEKLQGNPERNEKAPERD